MKEIKVTEEFIKEMEQYRQPDKSKGLLYACSQNVVVFAEYMLGIRLYAWQVYFLNKIQENLKDGGRREFIAITSRQIGKSTAVAIWSLWCALFNKYPGTIMNNTSVGIASASDTQAKKLLHEMKRLIRIGDRYMHDTYYKTGKMSCGEEFFSGLLDPNEANNTTTITFLPYDENKHGEYVLVGSKAGSSIKSYPPTSVVLGETFSVVIIDEAGKTEKLTDTFFYDYMYPTGNSTDAIRIYTSTPWLCSGFFYRMVDPDDLYVETPADVVTFTIDAIRIENKKYYDTVMKTIRQLNADGKTDEVQRAYYCRFVKGEQAYFDPIDVIEMFDATQQKVPQFSEPCDLGVDFGGQVTSKTVLTVSTCDEDGHIKRLWHKVYEVGKDDTLIEDIENEVMPYFNIQRIIPDECLEEHTNVLMSDYSRKPIKDIKAGDLVWSYNSREDSFEVKPVLKVVDKGMLPTKKILFRNGTCVYATGAHEWFVKDRVYQRVKVVSTDKIDRKKQYIPLLSRTKREERISKEEYAKYYLLGMYIAEGHKRPTKKAFFISQLKQEGRERIRENLKLTNWIWQENKRGFYLSDVKSFEPLFNSVGYSAENKRIPEELFSRCSYNQLDALRDGLMDGDGNIQYEYIDKRGYHIGRDERYYTCSLQLAKDFQLLGLLIGKPCSLSSRVHSGFGSTRKQYELSYRPNGSLCLGRLNIRDITDGGIKHVYDIKVEDNQSFIIADCGAVTHNCPQGDYMIRIMEDRGWEVEPMNFRTDKVKKYGAFRSALHRGNIKSYMDDELKTEMLALEFSKGRRQSVIEHAPGYTDDLIDSFIMSCYFYVQEEGEVSLFDWYDENDD